MRKAKAKVRYLEPDYKHNDVLVSQFINNLMLSGKKSTATAVFYDALEIIESKKVAEGVSALDVWKKAVENVTPQVEVKSRKVGGGTFQIPRPVRPSRRLSLSVKWIIQYARERKGKPMAEKLAEEIVAAYKEEGSAFKKKEDTHKMAEANKAFSHIRF